jgi:PAS domain S-box-containing protein
MGKIPKSAQAPRTDWEANYREIFNSANDAIFVHDFRTARILDANLKARQMYGIHTADIRRQVGDFSSGKPPFTQARAVQLVRSVKRGNPLLFEWHAKKPDGSLFWVEVNLKRARLSGRDCVLAVVRDITRRKQVQQQFAEARQRSLDVIAEMNHHIRNALEEINLSAHLTRNQEVISNISLASERIEWALREILPGAGNAGHEQ